MGWVVAEALPPFGLQVPTPVAPAPVLAAHAHGALPLVSPAGWVFWGGGLFGWVGAAGVQEGFGGVCEEALRCGILRGGM